MDKARLRTMKAHLIAACGEKVKRLKKKFRGHTRKPIIILKFKVSISNPPKNNASTNLNNRFNLI